MIKQFIKKSFELAALAISKKNNIPEFLLKPMYKKIGPLAPSLAKTSIAEKSALAIGASIVLGVTGYSGYSSYLFVRTKMTISNFNPELKAFFQNITARETDRQQNIQMSEQINDKDLNQVYLCARGLILEHPMFNEMEKGTAIHVGRHSVNEKLKFPPRAIAIQRDVHGAYGLILETKSKWESEPDLRIDIASVAASFPSLPLDKKNKIRAEYNVRYRNRYPSGTTFIGDTKKGKTSWRIDTRVPEEYVSMVVKKSTSFQKLVDRDKYHTVLNEKYILSKLPTDSELINRPTYGEYISPGTMNDFIGKPLCEKIVSYSPRALCDIEAVNQGSYYFRVDSSQAPGLNSSRIPVLTEHEENDIAIQMLKAVEFIHKNNIAHQDIQPSNFLIIKKQDGTFGVKLTDFGFAAVIGSNYQLNSPSCYESPEFTFVAKYFIKKPSYLLYDKDSKPTITRSGFYNLLNSPFQPDFKVDGMFTFPLLSLKAYQRAEKDGLLSDVLEKDDKLESLKLPHPANDMWAMGCALDELFSKNKDVSVIEKRKPLLLPFWELDRSKRITASDAVKLFTDKLKSQDVPSGGSESNVSSVSAITFVEASGGLSKLPRAKL